MSRLELDRIEIGKLLDAGRDSVKKWHQEEGFPEPRKDGRKWVYDANAVVMWWHKRELAKKVSSTGGETVNAAQERAQLTRLQRQRQALAYARESGELIPLDQAERYAFVLGRQLRDAMAHAPQQIAARAANRPHREVAAVAAEQLAEIMQAFQDGIDSLSDELRPTDLSVSASTEEGDGVPA